MESKIAIHNTAPPDVDNNNNILIDGIGEQFLILIAFNLQVNKFIEGK